MSDAGPPSERWVVISGCSGGGKSTLVLGLAGRGYRTVEEPGRRIVAQELDGDGRALPWIDPAAFARRAMSLALADRLSLEGAADWVFFDRGLVDAAAALERETGRPAPTILTDRDRYHRRVFLTPPWPEIYVADAARRLGFDAALREYAHLLEVYPALGYEVVVLPKASVSERADFIIATLGRRAAPPSQNPP